MTGDAYFFAFFNVLLEMLRREPPDARTKR